MSISMAVTRGLLRFAPLATATEESTRAKAERGLHPAEIPASVRRIAHVQRREIGGRTVVDLSLKNGSSRGHLIYLHGGAYAFPLIAAHWSIVGSLMRASGASVTVPLYGLAPRHGVTEAYALLDALYDEATTRHERVYLAGDSAGGGLALGQAMRVRDHGGRPPAGVILFSPWVDATMENPDVAGLAPLDRLIAPAGLAAAARWWAGEVGVRSPLVSPLFGDLAGLPPVSTHQGDHDILYADAVLLDAGIRAAGGSSTLDVYPGAFHDFVGAPWTPEARLALTRAAAVLAAG
jgi:RND superfamily putative drug exporter